MTYLHNNLIWFRFSAHASKLLVITYRIPIKTEIHKKAKNLSIGQKIVSMERKIMTSCNTISYQVCADR